MAATGSILDAVRRVAPAPLRLVPSPPDGGSACGTCGAPLAPGQEWCLECGTAAGGPASGRPGWTGPVAILAAVVLLVASMSAIAYAALSSSASKKAQAEAELKPATSPTPVAGGSPPSRGNLTTVRLPPATALPVARLPTAGSATSTPTPLPPATAAPTGSSVPTTGTTGTGTTPTTPATPVSHALIATSSAWSTTGANSASLSFGFSEQHAGSGTSAPITEIRVVVPAAAGGAPRHITSYGAPSGLSSCSIGTTNFPSDTVTCRGSLAVGQSTSLTVSMDPGPSAGMGGDLTAVRGGTAKTFSISGPATGAPAPKPTPVTFSASASWGGSGSSSSLSFTFSPESPQPGAQYDPITQIRVVLPQDSKTGKGRQITGFSAPSGLSSCTVSTSRLPRDTLVCSGRLALGESSSLSISMTPDATPGMGGSLYGVQDGNERGPFGIGGP